MPAPSASRRISITEKIKSLRRMSREIVSDVPQAVSREWNYYRGVRPSAIFTLTWRCTSHCHSCTVWRRGGDPSSELTGQQWLKVAAMLVERGANSFELFGGDVLLRKDVLFPLCQFLHSAGCKVYIPTNGNLLDEETAEKLAETTHALFLSTDALEHGHDYIRGTPGTFNRLHQARLHLLKARGQRSEPKIICNTTVSRYNVGQLAQLAEFALQAGFDQIDLEYVGQFESRHVASSCIDGQPPSPIYLRQGKSCLIMQDQVGLLRSQLAAARALRGRPTVSCRPFEVVTINIDMLSDGDLVAGTVPKRCCFMEHMTTIIDPYGNILPCLFFENYRIGNILKGGLDEPWQFRRREEFRKLRREGKLELCRHCIMSVIRNRTGIDILRRAAVSGADRFAVQACFCLLFGCVGRLQRILKK